MIHKTKFQIEGNKIIEVSFNDENKEFECSLSYSVKKLIEKKPVEKPNVVIKTEIEEPEIEEKEESRLLF